MNINDIHQVLSSNYNINIKSIELFREGGNCSYVIHSANHECFLKVIRPPFLETALQSVDIQMYLLQNRFPVIPIILTKTDTPYVQTGEQGTESVFVLYDYIEGGEPDPEDTEEAGALIGKLHLIMKGYTGCLPVKDKHFFIDRYIEIMRKIQYPKSEAFRLYGDELWDKVKDLPRGYCHGDLYRGNIHKSADKAMYIVDFDTSCFAFPIYDVVLFCNDTHYFDFDNNGYEKTKARLEKFLSGYLRHCPLTQEEISAVYDMIAVYHFQLQATMLEIHGYDAGIVDFIDKQYDWLLRWKEQCSSICTMK
jgi:Ser/Thr protein kinase RdoA (MazF antagonist)